MKNKYLKLFASCIPVKGNQRSIICDLQRYTYHFIPNDLYFFIKNESNIIIKEIYKKYTGSNSKIIRKYIDFLIEEEYAFLCDTDELEFFPQLSLEWKTPSIINNAIIDIEYDTLDLEKYSFIFDELSKFGCIAVQIRAYNDINTSTIKNLLKFINTTSIEVIELYLKYSEFIDNDFLFNLKKENQKIFRLIVHSSPYYKNIEIPFEATAINYTTETILSSKNCGIIRDKHMIVNLHLFTEAQRHNTCLNRKIAIDVEGNIKNCPSMPHSYGNIKDTTLKEALEHPDFKKYWYIHKDQIEVCKDCEFRYICTDCRAYLEDPHNLYSKPLKCGYNPYTGEWEEWSTNPLKQKAIEYYGMQELVKKETD
jgi:SPASM domain peptide maturase of grasp-with-spasm system